MEPDESPRECAVREAEEESGVTVQLGGVLGVLGGPEYRVTYPNGDQTAYVVTVFDATVIAGSPRPDGDETSEVGWFQPEELPFSEMGGLAMALFRDLGLAAPDTHRATEPMLVVVTGLQGSGKSTVAGIVAHALGAPVISHDWAMSGLRPFPEVQATLDAMGSGGHGQLGWSILRSLAQSQLEHGLPVVLDGVARAPQIESLRRLAKEAGVRLFVIMTECSDVELHRSRIEGRERGIPGWYELDWSHVEQSRQSWDPNMAVDLKVDSAKPLSMIDRSLGDRVAAWREGTGGSPAL